MRVGLLVLALVMSGCWSADEETPATVELDVFSGEPNPTWQATREETQEIHAQLVGVEQVKTAEPPAGRLGYRGFTVTLGGADNPRVYDVGSGLIVAHITPQAVDVFTDRGLEAVLLVHARRHGAAEILRAAMK
jgi:hypothetical protein